MEKQLIDAMVFYYSHYAVSLSILLKPLSLLYLKKHLTEMSLSATTITVTLQSGDCTQAKFHVLVRTKGHLSLGHLVLVNCLLLNIEDISQEL